ncbi:MAG: hypothetical protein HYT93_00320 [Parcubacteria group bacterium]|nr:hypothetical protein [Parcubacteria group bacterium]
MARFLSAIRSVSFITAFAFALFGFLSVSAQQSFAATGESVAVEQKSETSSATPEANSQETMVTVLRTQRYVISIPGDSLTKLSGRFGVSRKMVLDANPQIASRTDPKRLYWLYLGEEVAVPVFVTELRKLHAVGAEELIAVPARTLIEHSSTKGKLEAASAALASAETKNTDLTNKNIALGATVTEMRKAMREFERTVKILWTGLVATLALLVVALVVAIMKKPELPLTGNRNEPTPPKAPGKDDSASLQSAEAPHQTGEKGQLAAPDVMKYLQSLTGAELKRLANTPLAVDEAGNPSPTIKKVSDFMENRPDLDLENHPLSEWPELIERKKRESAEKTPAAA